MPELKRELDAKGFPSDPEHCVIHAMFPQQLEAHLKGENKNVTVSMPAQVGKNKNGSREKKSYFRYSMRINGKPVEVSVEDVT